MLALVGLLVVALGVGVLTGAIGPLGDSPTSKAPAAQPYEQQPPSALPAAGTYQRTRITRTGVVHVTQWVRSRKTLGSIDLTTAGTTPAATMTASDLVVAADGSRIPAPATVGSDGRHIDFPRRAKLVYLSYRLSGVLNRASSVRGRVLVQATALRLSYRPRTGPAVVRIQAPKITTTACTDAPVRDVVGQQTLSDPYVCGTPSRSPSTWTVKLTKKHRGASVSAQVELR